MLFNMLLLFRSLFLALFFDELTDEQIDEVVEVSILDIATSRQLDSALSWETDLNNRSLESRIDLSNSSFRLLSFSISNISGEPQRSIDFTIACFRKYSLKKITK